MPRVYRTPKEREIFVIRQFLNAAGYRMSRLRLGERPDSTVTLCTSTVAKRVGIELTGYFTDALHGKPSPGGRLYDFWRLVLASVVRRTCRRPGLRSVMASVCFKREVPAASTTEEGHRQTARALAAELVELAMSTRLTPDGATIVWNRALQGPLSRLLVTSVIFMRGVAGSLPRMNWTCTNATAGCVATILPHVVAAVQNKAEKAAKYDWIGCQERWLLIAASGDIVSQRAGPADQHVDWNDQELHDACATSGFDRIVFYAYPFWYKELWPGAPLVDVMSGSVIGSPD